MRFCLFCFKQKEHLLKVCQEKGSHPICTGVIHTKHHSKTPKGIYKKLLIHLQGRLRKSIIEELSFPTKHGTT